MFYFHFLCVCLCVLQHARALEAFSKFIAISPDLLVPLLTASFECMAAIPLEQSGQLPPPAKVTFKWKEEAMARVSMSKVGGVSVERLLLLSFDPKMLPEHTRCVISRAVDVADAWWRLACYHICQLLPPAKVIVEWKETAMA